MVVDVNLSLNIWRICSHLVFVDR